MEFQKKVALKGSERRTMLNAQVVGPVAPDAQITVSVLLRRRSAAHPKIGDVLSKGLSHDEFAQLHGAHPSDIQVVEAFAHQYGLTVVSTSIAMRRVVLSGTAANFEKAFDAALQCYKVDETGPVFRGRTGQIQIPADMSDMVVAILGMDNRPVAKPHFRMRAQQGAPATTFTPPQVAAAYNYPQGVDGTGQTIALIELGGGYQASDLQTYFGGLGIKTPSVTAVGVDGGTNSPGSDADGEVLLDIEVAGAIAPGASIAVYFAPNTDQGFVDAVLDAAHDTTRKPSVISISWGGPEDQWTDQSRAALNQALEDCASLNITVTVASGDNGSSDGVSDGKLHVDFPASSPYALACGGTTLTASGNQIQSEVVWNETSLQEGAGGGGISIEFPIPSYQANAAVPVNPETNYAGRGVPDVAGNADPQTGYQVLVDGQAQIVGGTSAVAPLWAALVALLNQSLGAPVGFINPTLYGLSGTATNDITQGNNDDSNLGSYNAGPGWDACTGLGSPNGAALLSALQAKAGTGTTSGQPTATGVGAC